MVKTLSGTTNLNVSKNLKANTVEVLSNIVISNSSIAASNGALVINTAGSVGTNGQLLTSNGTVAYWNTPSYITNTYSGTLSGNLTFSGNIISFANGITIGNSTVNVSINSTSLVATSIFANNELDYNVNNSAFPARTPVLSLNFVSTESFDARLSCTRNSNATYIAKSGFIEYAGVNEPRIEYDTATGECRGLLSEQASNNYILYSTSFYQNVWSNTVSGGSGRIDGFAAFGYHVIIANNAANGGIRQVVNSLGNSVYTASFHMQCNTSYSSANTLDAYFVLEDGANTYGTDCSARIGLANGFISEVIGFTSYSKYPYADGFVYSFVLPPSGGSNKIANLEWRVKDASTDSNRRIVLSRPQLEAKPYSSSFIPTNQVPVSRDSDYFEMNLAYGSVKSQEITIIESFSVFTNNLNNPLWTYGPAGEIIIQNTNYDNCAITIKSISPLATVANLVFDLLPTNTLCKIAVASKKDSFAACLNGGTVITDNSGNVAPTWSGDQPLRLFFLNGHLKRVSVYNSRLSNQYLKTLTL